jgi:hypothetical protein
MLVLFINKRFDKHNVGVAIRTAITRAGNPREKASMTRALAWVGVAVAGLVAAAPVDEARAQAKSLTLCWAAWDTANALVELGKVFTAKTGIEMK